MSNINNAPPVVDNNGVVDKKVVKQKMKIVQPGFRPLPQADENQLHCIIQPVYPVYPGQNVIVKQPINVGYPNEVIVPQGTGMIKEPGYVEKQTKIKETIKQPAVM